MIIGYVGVELHYIPETNEENISDGSLALCGEVSSGIPFNRMCIYVLTVLLIHVIDQFYLK